MIDLILVSALSDDEVRRVRGLIEATPEGSVDLRLGDGYKPYLVIERLNYPFRELMDRFTLLENT